MRNINRIQNSIFLIVFFFFFFIGLFCLFSKIHHFYMMNGLLKTEQIQWYANILRYLLPCCLISYVGFKMTKTLLSFDNCFYRIKLIFSVFFYGLCYTFSMLFCLTTLFFLLDKFYNVVVLYYLLKFCMIIVVYFYVTNFVVKLLKFKLSDWQNELNL